MLGQNAVAAAPTSHTHDGFFTEDPAEPEQAPFDPYAFDLVDDAAPSPAMSPPPTRTFKKKKKRASYSGGEFSEWIRGPGLWILDGVGLAILLILMTVGVSQVAGQSVHSAAFTAGFFIGFGIIFTIVVGIAALLLLAACSMLGEDPPSLGRAMGIVFLIWEAQFVAGLIVGTITGAATPGNFDLSQLIVPLVINLCVGCAVAAAVLSVTLDISFGKGILIWIVEIVIGIVVLVVLFFLLALALPGLQQLRGPQEVVPNTPPSSSTGPGALGVSRPSAGSSATAPSSSGKPPRPPAALPQSVPPSAPSASQQVPVTPPNQTSSKSTRIILSNARIWTDKGIGLPKTAFSVDYTIEQMGSITDSFDLIIKSARGDSARMRVFWSGLNSRKGVAGLPGNEGTLAGTISSVSFSVNNGPFEAYVETERWDHSTFPMKRVQEKVSDVIGVAVTEAPTQPGRSPGEFPGRRPGDMPGGLPGRGPGSPGGPGSGFPGGGPGGLPGPPGGFPGRVPGGRS